MPIAWSTTDQLAKTNGIKSLIYGPSGAGKTVLGATAPRPVIISSENGQLSLNRKNLEAIFGPERAASMLSIPVMTIRNGLDLKDAYEWVTAPANQKHFDSVVWDSASETAEVMLGASKAAKNDGRQAYGEVADIITEYVRKFRDNLPGKNVVILTKMEALKDGVSGSMYWGPSFPGQKLGPASPYWLDEVFRVGVGVDPATNKNYRFIQTGRDQQYDGKDRSGILDFYEYPDLTHIFAKITGGLQQ